MAFNISMAINHCELELHCMHSASAMNFQSSDHLRQAAARCGFNDKYRLCLALWDCLHAGQMWSSEILAEPLPPTQIHPGV